MSFVVFPETETSFTIGLARWIAPPTPAAATGGAAEPTPSAFEAECAKLEGASDFKALSAKLRTGLKGKFTEGSTSDAVNAYAIFFELLTQWQLLNETAPSLADELASAPAELPERRTAVLLALYSLAQQEGAPSELRFTLLLRLVAFCTKTGDLGKVLGPVEHRVERVERWVRGWKLTDAEQKELWGLVFDAHADASARVMYDCALKYFTLHEGAELSTLPALRERIVQGVLLTLRSPELFRCDELAHLQVVQQLKNDAEMGSLHRMLQIMASDTYAEYVAFSADAKAKALLEKHGLKTDELARKMRLLTLVSLGHVDKELTYKAIATALHVAVDEVETWVMQAIASGLITAKMDQVRELVAVSMCAERDFGQTQWKRLHGSLVDWRDSIQKLLTLLENARSVA